MNPATIMAAMQALNGLAQLSVQLSALMRTARENGDISDEQWATIEADWQTTKAAWDAAPGPRPGV